MLYENYRRKVTKIADFFKVLRRFRVLIICVLLGVLAITATLLGITGIVYDVSDCPDEVEYGQPLGYEAGAIFAPVKYEYAQEGSDDWTDEVPTRAGNYKVRAVSKNVFGGDRYGGVFAFSIVPKEIDVKIDQESVEYGSDPAVTADLAYSDRVECTQFVYADVSAQYTQVAAVEEGIKIYDEGGTDVTSSYIINPVSSLIAFEKRAITVTVEDKSAVYDGNRLEYGAYELSADTPLADGDEIFAVFDDYITEPGEAENIPEIRIYHNLGGTRKEVTGNYNINIQAGTLTVEKRPITISTGDGEWVYDGEAHDFGGFELSEASEYGLVEGHTLATSTLTAVTDAGEYENLISFTVSDKEGNDVTDCYSVFINPGTLTVNKRTVTVATDDYTFMYNGNAQYYGGWSVAESSQYGLVDGQEGLSDDLSTITDVGTAENQMTLYVFDSENADKTGNYEFAYEYGTLTMAPRPVNISTNSWWWTYDGLPHSDEDGYAWTCNIDDVNYYDLVSGHYIQSDLEDASTITDAGSTDNVYCIKITDGSTDKTANYDIDFTYGTLTISPRPITITSGSAQKDYDGLPIACDSFEVSTYLLDENGEEDEALVLDHYADVTMTGTQTDIGKSYNYIDFKSVSIFTEGGRDVTFNYSIGYNYGELKVMIPGKLIITTESAAKVYDGEWLSADGIEVDCTTYNFGMGYPAEFEVYAYAGGMILNAGEKSNSYYLDVFSDGINGSLAGYNLAEFAHVEEHIGTLTVHKRPVSITTESGEWIYDGEVHITGLPEFGTAISEFDGKEYGILDGHFTSYIQNWDTQIVNVGEKENAVNLSSEVGMEAGGYIAIKGYDAETGNSFADLTSNYVFTKNYGTLTIYPRPITVATDDHEWVYDGQEHSCNHDPAYTLGDGVIGEDDYEGKFVGSYPIVSGHTFAVDGMASITNVGVVPNTPYFTIYGYNAETGENNADLTSNYVAQGISTLTVVGRPITITTGSGSWPYDGQPHGKPGYTVSSGEYNGVEYGVLPDDTLTVTDFPEITEIGNIPNAPVIVITGYDPVTQTYDADVTSNYQITIDFGTLTVYDPEVDVPASDLDGSGNIGGGSLGGAGNAVTLKILSEIDGQVYLRLKSFGDYYGASWAQAPQYSELLDGKYSLTYLTGAALAAAGYVSYEISIEQFTNDYLLPYYMAMGDFGYDVQASDVLYSGDVSSIYSLEYYMYDYVKEGAPEVGLGAYASAEEAYRQFVRQNYLSVPQSTLQYLSGIISAQGFSTDDPDIIEKVASYIQNAATYNLEYDSGLDKEEDIVVAFLESYKEGICQHYASAATLLYRALGIPARYTIGYVGNAVAGEWVNVTPNTAHAWVEVYIDGLGWVYVEVTGGGAGGGGGAIDEERQITIKPDDEKKVYDGTPLVADTVVGTDGENQLKLHNLLESGYTYYAEFSGSVTEVGTASSAITSFVLYDPEGNDVTDQFEFTFEEGVLQVVDYPVITVHLFAIQKVYDGSPLAYSANDYWVSGLPEGWTLSVDGMSSVSLTDAGMLTAGEIQQMVTISVYDENGNQMTAEEDYTAAFDGSGYIIVAKRQITITSQSDSKVYDGTPLSNDGFFISSGSLAARHTATVELNVSITDIGKVANKFENVVIADAEGNDVTENYDMDCIFGILEIVSD